MNRRISVKNLSKVYSIHDRREGLLGSVLDLFWRTSREIKAVDNISFEIAEGEIVGYIGANGAGKSTTIKLLTGILHPTSGSIDVFGYQPAKDRKEYTKHIGVVFGQRTQLWWDIPVKETYALLKSIYRISTGEYIDRLNYLSELLGIREILHVPVRKLSLGQRMRCDLLAALIHNPKVLFLDEPTIGLDALGKSTVRRFLRRINRDLSTTIMLTTHDLFEIEELCPRIMLIDRGKLVFDGTIQKLKALSGIGKSVYIDLGHRITSKEEAFLNTLGIKRLEALEGTWLKLTFDPNEVPVAKIVTAICKQFRVIDLKVTDPSIEDIVMRLYNKKLAV